VTENRVSKVNMLLIAVAFVAAAALLWRLRPVLPPFLYALVLAYLLQPLHQRLLERGVGERAALVLLYAMLALTAAFFLIKIVPLLFRQLLELLQMLPQLLEVLNSYKQQLQNHLGYTLPPPLAEQLQSMLQAATAQFAVSAEEKLLQILSSGRSFLSLLLAPVLSYYILHDRLLLQQQTLQIPPPQQRDELRRLGGEIDHLLRQYIYGYVLIAVIVGLLSTIVLLLLNVRYAPALGLIMGICDLVPYIGPFIGAVPAVAVALGQGSNTALYTALALLLVQQAESMVITPLIMDKRTGLHPVATIFVVLSGAYLFGLAGSVLAVPFCLAASLLIRYIYGRIVGWQPKT